MMPTGLPFPSRVTRLGLLAATCARICANEASAPSAARAAFAAAPCAGLVRSNAGVCVVVLAMKLLTVLWKKPTEA